MTGTRLVCGRFLFAVVCIGGLTFGAAAPLMAGQGADATIFGQVTDTSGAVLPGVTVTLTGPALQVPQIVTVTDATGDYRVTPLPLGIYAVDYTLPGFQTVRREGIRLTAGFVARLNVSLAVGGVAETVTVSGASPVVDVKTTSAGTQVAREILDTIPTQRNSFNSLLTLAAGARPDIDQVSLTTDVVFRAFGRSGESWSTVDGLPVTAPRDDGNTGYQSSFNYSAIEEASVHTLGTNAEAPTSGIQLNVVTKSGGNEFHGAVLLAQTPDWLETESNLDAQLRAQGITASPQSYSRWDRGGDVGGRVIRDKLWFWTGWRRRQQEQEVLGAFYPDGTPSTVLNDDKYGSGKVTYQITPGQQLIGTVHGRDQYRVVGPESRFIIDRVRALNFITFPQTQATWQMVRGNRVLSVQGGIQNVYRPWNDPLRELASWQDDVTAYRGGPDIRDGRRFLFDRRSVQATLNWYKPDWSGNHDFKIGALYTVASDVDVARDTGVTIGNYTLRYRNGVPDSVAALNNPVDPKMKIGNLGLYLQDSWAVNRRLTMNLGVRYANDRGWLPPACRVAAPREFANLFPASCFPRMALKTWNPVMPRVHAAYDVIGDGKTVIKGGWGRFYMMHERPELDVLNPNAQKEARFRWHPATYLGPGRDYFRAGDSNLDLNGPDFLGINVASYTVETPGITTSVPLTNLQSNPDLKEQGSDEFSVSVERELIANLGVRVTGLYVREFNVQRIANPLRPYAAYNIPVTYVNPGVDGVRGTADDPGTSITYYDYPASLRGTAFNASMFINDPKADASYKSFEVALNKRLSNRWQMLASYSGTKLNVPVPRNAEFTPNAEIFSADHTYEWLFRTSGSYQFPLDFQVSSNLLVQSGIQYAMTVSAAGGVQIPSIAVFAEEIGTRKAATLTFMTLGLEKAFRLPRAQRLAVGLNFSNVLNGNSPTVVPQTRAGSQFGYATSVASPRIGEVTLRYRF